LVHQEAAWRRRRGTGRRNHRQRNPVQGEPGAIAGVSTGVSPISMEQEATMNLFANARNRSLPPLFRWENEPAQWTFLEDGTLSVTAPEQTDLFCDPAGRHVDNVPFLYRELTGDFQVWTRVEVDLEAEFDAACLVVRGPEGQWAKLALEYPNRIPTIVSVVTRQTSDDANHERLQEPSALLRISRMGQTFAFHYT